MVVVESEKIARMQEWLREHETRLDEYGRTLDTHESRITDLEELMGMYVFPRVRSSSKFSSPRICKQCGRELWKGETRCVRCGYQVESSPQEGFERIVTPYVLEVEPPDITIVTKSPQAWVLITHRRATRMRLLGWKTVPEILYPIPKLIVEEMPLEEQKFVAGLIEADGCLRPVRDRRDRIDLEYRYVYLRPVFVFDMTEEPPVRRVAEALGLEYHAYPRPPPRQDRYEIHTSGTPAISIAHWALPLLTSSSKRAKDAQLLLKTFRETPSIKLR